jgi:phage shock protein C
VTAEQGARFEPETGAAAQPRRLYRSTRNRVLAGVCGGIAEEYGSDPTAVRLAALIIGLLTGIFPMLILYIAAAVIVPERSGAQAGVSLPANVSSGSATLFLGAVLILGGLAGVANEWLRVDWDLAWPFIAIGLGVSILVLATRRR